MSCCEENYLPINFDVFLPITAGDTYPEGVSFAEDGVDQVLTAVEIAFKSDPEKADDDLLLSSAGGTITLDSTSANDWRWSVPAFLVSLSAGDYSYQVKCTYGAGKVITLINGELPVQPSI